MALRVEPTPTPVPTNGRCTPMENTPVYSISSVCRPWGKLSAVKRLIAQMTHRVHLISPAYLVIMPFSFLRNRVMAGGLLR